MKRVLTFFWPDLTDDECHRYGFLSLIFFFVIAASWILRIVRDSVFFTIAFPESVGWSAGQGALFQPYAKIASVFVIAGAVGLYSRLVDYFSRHRLFYILATLFTVIFSAIALVLLVADLYGSEVVGRSLLASAGWVAFFSVECYSSLMVSLFWSFVVSISMIERAKVGFPLILVGGQLGAIVGSFVSGRVSASYPVWLLIFCGIVSIVSVALLVYRFVQTEFDGGAYSATIVKQHEQQETFIESFVIGLKLMASHRYLLGIAIVATFYEMIATIVEYQMYRLAMATAAYGSPQGFSYFLSQFGIATNTFSCITVLLGTSFLLRRLGLRYSLLIYATVVSAGLCLQYGASVYAAPEHVFWCTFVLMVLIKGLGFALVVPSKEIMYIPTSKEIQFKTKGWIDSFGARSAKMGGAQFTNFFKHELHHLMGYGTILCLGLMVSWMSAAWYVGKKNRALMERDEIIQ